MSLSSDHRAANAPLNSAAQHADGDASKRRSVRCAQPQCRKEGLFPAPSAREGRRGRARLCLKHARDANSAWNIFAGMSDDEVEDAIRAASVGERPTWPVDARPRRNDKQREKHGDWHERKFDEEEMRFDFSTKRRHRYTQEPLTKTRDGRETSSNATMLRHPRTHAEQEACRVMSLTPPICAQQLKTRYRALAKAHHPDQHLARIQNGKKQELKNQELKPRNEKAQDSKNSDSNATDEARLREQQERQKEHQEGFKRINAAYALLQTLWQQGESATQRKA